MDKRIAETLRDLTVPLAATVLGMLVGTIFILIAGKSPMEAYGYFIDYVIGSPRAIGEWLVSTTPLIFTGLAVALAFRCGLFNIGVEGQYLVGQAAAAWAGFTFALPGALHPWVAIVAGAVAGAIWSAIPGVLKAYRGVHEVINTIMLNYTALFFTHWLVMNRMRDPSGAAGTPSVRETATFAQGLLVGSRAHVGIFVAVGAAVLVWFLLWKTALGYEIRSVGYSPGAAEYAGISVKGNIILAMALSGVLSGAAAAVQTLAISRRFYEPLGFAGYGFDGIAVALVGRNHPAGVVLAALLFGALDRGGAGMQAGADVPKSVMWVVQGAIIFFVAAEGLWHFVKHRRVKSEVKGV